MLKRLILQLIAAEGPIAKSRVVFVVQSWPGYEMETETSIHEAIEDLDSAESIIKTYAHKDIYLEIN